MIDVNAKVIFYHSIYIFSFAIGFQIICQEKFDADAIFFYIGIFIALKLSDSFNH